jgi:1-deoxy-D-xylulose-5-phosphate synthase
MGVNMDTILDQINDPSDLRKLKSEQLPEVCNELRSFIIDAVSTNPGHLGASLGVVELTVALHYVFETPYDLLVWDVGHQAYGHKILTGRKEVFHTNRKYKGISGFPKPTESIYDSFGVGHSSTSISAALGMAVASRMKNEKDRKIVAIIGDGALSGGMAFEGLNNAAVDKSDLLVILNDNNMAIDPNVGGMNNYLLKITKSRTYNNLKKNVWEGLGRLNGFGPKARRIVQKTEQALKSALLKQSNLFEGMGFRYFGPVDGHDVVYLAEVLRSLSQISGPKLLHVVTKKGKGFKLAELNQTEYHAPGKFDKVTGELLDCECSLNKPPKFQNVFGQTMIELAEKNSKIVAITPAMPSGCSLNLMMEKMPERVFDVGIAEQHAVTFSAGLAIQGMIPYCNIYSTFMQRAYDQIIHDVALQNLQVVFCLDRGGLVGADGATHHGVFDLAYMRSIPNMIVSAPMDEIELRNLLFTAQNKNHGPFSIRYPRGCGCIIDWEKPMIDIPVGKSRLLSEGNDMALLTIGTVGIQASRVVKMLQKEEIYAAHYDMRFVKPLDEDVLHDIFKKYKKVVTIEDGVLQGGFGSAVIEFMSNHKYHVNLIRIGLPDQFIDHGTIDELYREYGLDQQGIYKTIKAFQIAE